MMSYCFNKRAIMKHKRLEMQRSKRVLDCRVLLESVAKALHVTAGQMSHSICCLFNTSLSQHLS